MDLEKELAELQDTLATSDFRSACNSMSQSKDLHYLILKVLQPIRLKMDGNKNHKRPHLHIDCGRQYRHTASYAIDTGERIVGESKYDYEVYEWIDRNRPKLLQVWELMQSGKDASPIACELRGE
jgi:hypothetical protein